MKQSCSVFCGFETERLFCFLKKVVERFFVVGVVVCLIDFGSGLNFEEGLVMEN